MKNYSPKSQVITTIYGDFKITEPLIIDLLNSKTVQRLKGVYQFGVVHYVQDFYPYTRYDHSVGVLALLRKYNQSLEEQVAGLLHDASHTVFSHVADYLFQGGSSDSSYQDDIHMWFLEKTDVADIVVKHGYKLEDFMHKKGDFLALEQDLPNLCADRIEYTIFEHVMESGMGDMSAVQKKVANILKDLKFQDGRWFFDNLEAAKKYASISLSFTEGRWASHWGMYTYTIAAQLLQRAIDIKLIDYDTIHFGTDDNVWNALQASRDGQIQDCLDKICHYSNAYKLGAIDDHNMHLKGKFRGVDPFVDTPQGLKNLSKLDQPFAKKFTELKEVVQQGVYIKSLVG